MTRASAVDQALETYRRKRDFAATAEPRGGPGAVAGRSFVVHKHAARRLHYDLRLEHDGVLKSWAVPRGPSHAPEDRRLAVRTEDHPLDYGMFEGTIPAGEYGGGTVMLWDRGTWRPLHDPDEGLHHGHLHFMLDGQRLKGEWSLVRIRPDGGRENWLLIKGRDGFSGRKDAALLGPRSRSVASGRTMAQIRDGKPVAEPAGPTEPGLPAGASTPRPSEPQLATLVDAAPDGEEWLHEIKHDGYRAMLAVGGGSARLFTRRGHDWTDRFQSLVTPALALGVGDALIDGEVVVVDAEGRSDFKRLQAALNEAAPALSFFAFDLLRLDGEDLSRRPLALRKRRLAELLGGRGRKGPIFFSDHVEGNGRAFLAAACERGLEGIVSKRADAPYRPGRGRTWQKCKCGREQELVIGGWMPSTAGRPFASLLLGWHDRDGRLRYAGRVGTGFDEAIFARVAPALQRRARRSSPFVDAPPEVRGRARWVRPDLVAAVAFTEVTKDGRLRHPSFQGLREDKPAAAVRRETVQ